ncbi:MAG: hypothetical protein OQJ97_06440 [Rhodospirillales bacterium]|nr:hypothetical protein [Rhodospirillales bacterium]
MLLAKLENKLDANQTIMEGVWMSSFGFFAVMAMEAYTVRYTGWENASYPNLLISLGLLFVAITIYKRKPNLAIIGYALPVLHLALNFDILLAMFDAMILYFIVNGIRAIKLHESLPEGPKEEETA